MNRISIFLIIIFSSIYSCKIITNTNNNNFYTTQSKLIENANIVGDNEIDTGQFSLLHFSRIYDEPYSIDEESEFVVIIKINSIDSLSIGKSIDIPTSDILVISYYSSVWTRIIYRDIAGKISRLESQNGVHKIKINLKGHSLDQKKKKLVNGTFEFKNDKEYFERNKIDYNGEYDNLRIALKEPEKVIKLDLSYSDLNSDNSEIDTNSSKLPIDIVDFVNLEELSLRSTNLIKLPSEISKLKNLKVLDLGYNEFSDFPMEILSLENLHTLNLEYSELEVIPKEISKLRNLAKLNLDYNSLTGFPTHITALNNLRDLSIRGDSITVIPTSIKNLEQLERLDLSSFWSYKRKNRPQNLEVLSNLKNLKELYLEFDGIKELPSQFSKLEKLEVLEIKFNDFKSFPEVIDKIPNLKLLIISHEEFDDSTMVSIKNKPKKYKVRIDNL